MHASMLVCACRERRAGWHAADLSKSRSAVVRDRGARMPRWFSSPLGGIPPGGNNARGLRRDQSHSGSLASRLSRYTAVMNRTRADDLGRLLLRLMVGGLMLFHGVAKLSHGVSRIGGRLTTHGVPAFVAYGVYIGEVVAPLLIIAGIGTRPAALVLAFNMLVAVWLSSAADVARLSPTGGWAIELQMLYLLSAIAIALLGSGRFAISRGKGRWD